MPAIKGEHAGGHTCIPKIQAPFKPGHNRSMASFKKNFTILMTLQISTYLAPLLTLSWLARVLGPNEYGRLSFALAFTAYFITLTNFSFNLTATPKVSINRDNREKRSQVFWETINTQAVIATCGFCVLLALTYLVPYLGENRELLLVGFGMAVGSMLIPTWYFQGIEDLAPISGLVFVGRALSIPAMYIFRPSSRRRLYRDDGEHAGAVVLGHRDLHVFVFRRELDFVPVSFRTIRERLKEGWSVFMATSLMDVDASSNIVLLTFMAGNVAGGYFATCDKLIRAALNMLQPLKTAAYPRVSFLMHYAREDAFAFLRKMFFYPGNDCFADFPVHFLRRAARGEAALWPAVSSDRRRAALDGIRTANVRHGRSLRRSDHASALHEVAFQPGADLFGGIELQFACRARQVVRRARCSGYRADYTNCNRIGYGVHALPARGAAAQAPITEGASS